MRVAGWQHRCIYSTRNARRFPERSRARKPVYGRAIRGFYWLLEKTARSVRGEGAQEEMEIRAGEEGAPPAREEEEVVLFPFI